MNAQELKLDYFQIYDITNQRVRYSVTLRGQFDKEPKKSELVILDWFANTTSKNGEPIFDRNAHLTCYYLYQPIPEPTRVVVLENQFGTQEIRIGHIRSLLTPAEKIEKGSEFPEKLDHYKVYRVLEGKSVERGVKLRDQFGTSEAEVTYPYAFAVPVKKEHAGKVFSIHNEKAHLAIYKISPREITRKSMVSDQFSRRYRYVEVVRSILLAVPSIKVKWGEV